MAKDTPRLRRHDPDVRAADDLRALNDPAVQRAIASLERRICTDIANGNTDGSSEQVQLDLENCRELRVITRLKRELGAGPDKQKLRESGFQPRQSSEG